MTLEVLISMWKVLGRKKINQQRNQSEQKNDGEKVRRERLPTTLTDIPFLYKYKYIGVIKSGCEPNCIFRAVNHNYTGPPDPSATAATLITPCYF